jgi:hypothetical protein
MLPVPVHATARIAPSILWRPLQNQPFASFWKSAFVCGTWIEEMCLTLYMLPEKLARALSERERIIKDHPSGHLPSHSSAHLSGNPGSYSEQPAHRREVDVNLQMKRYTNSCHPSKRRSTILSSKKHKSHLNPHLREVQDSVTTLPWPFDTHPDLLTHPHVM